MNRIFVCGDLHSNIDISKITSKHFTVGKELDKNDYLIIAGDFGFIWENTIDMKEDYWMQWFKDKPWTTLVVPGNHENYNRIFNLPISEMFGGKVRKYNESVILLERGEVYTIANKTFWIMGGGLSIDKKYRTLGISYWNQEIPSTEEMNYGINNLQRLNGEVDYIITHAGPKGFINKILGNVIIGDLDTNKYNDPTSKYLDEILNTHLQKYRCWLFGHYHVDADMLEDKARALFYDVIELDTNIDIGYKIAKK